MKQIHNIKKVAVTHYELLDSGSFEKLERMGSVVMRRPCPQAVWPRRLGESEWKRWGLYFERNSSGQGTWHEKKKGLLNESVLLAWGGGLESIARPTSFGHLGFFAEQKDNWNWILENYSPLLEKSAGKSEPFKMLNLFAYTGIASVYGAAAGMDVTHVDASKASVEWGKEHVAHNKNRLKGSVRWITEDVCQFVKKEIRRGVRYDAIMLDPPSFGRGERSQVWKIEDHLIGLLEQLREVWQPGKNGFIQLSSHSQGYTPIALSQLLSRVFKEQASKPNAHVISNEMAIQGDAGLKLPAGAESWLCVGMNRALSHV